jgi:hypothetical protein
LEEIVELERGTSTSAEGGVVDSEERGVIEHVAARALDRVLTLPFHETSLRGPRPLMTNGPVNQRSAAERHAS